MAGAFTRFLVLFCFSLVFALPAHAKKDKIEALTDGNIKSFIEETSYMTSGGSKNLSLSKVKTYLEKHLEDDARFKSTMKYNLPGMPPQEQAVSLSKEEFIESVEKGAEKIDDYETIVEIKDIKISSDEQKAFVKTESTELVTMPVPSQNGGMEYVPVEGLSSCTQILSLNKGVIQMYSAQCATEINFMDY